MVENSKNLIKLSNKEIAEELIGEKKEFPKYVKPLLNLANRFAQGTRPKIVGQMTELIKECPENTYEGWVKWYKSNYSENLKNATKKVGQMIDQFKIVLDSIDEKIMTKWVEDLTLDKTYIGLKLEKVIIKKIANLAKKNYRFATPQEEARGIDGFIGREAISVKPETYKTKDELIEKIEAKIIYYEKNKKDSSVKIDINEFLKK